MKITGLLKAINSKSDIYGNRYWAMEFTDFKSGKVVVGSVSGGESNIYGLLRYWNKKGDWDGSILFETEEMPIRKFERHTKAFNYAGCGSEELADYLKAELKR
jgi:hypothetical protein